MSRSCREIITQTNVAYLLQKQKNHEEFCHVTLQVENEIFDAHRCVLSAVSEYFLKMFTTKMKEKHCQVISIHTVTAHAVREILNSIYTGKIILSEDNLTEIVHAASMMQIAHVLSAATNFMRDNLSGSNCFFFKDLATLYSFEGLAEVIDQFILQHIVEIYNDDRFFELPLNDIEELLKSNDLRVDDEDIAFEILLKWVNKDLTERQQHFAQLFKHVRLQFIPIKQVVEVIAKNQLVKKDHECRDLIDETVSFHINPSSEASQKPRNCFASVPDSLLCFSYQNNTQSSYNLASEHYSNFCFSISTNILKDCAVASNQPETVFCGGIDSRENASTQVLTFNKVRWTTLPSLNTARCGAAAAFHGSKLYVFGGEIIPVSKDKTFYSSEETNPSFSNFAKSFETLNESWKQTINDWQVRSYFSAQAINGKIYLIGGYKPQIINVHSHYNLMYNNYQCKLKVVCADTIIYSPEEDTWKIGGQLNKARASFGCAAHQSSIYVVGGYSDNSEISSVEFKNRQDFTWTLCSSSVAKGGPKSVCFVRNRMYVASKSSVDKVIAFELEEKDVKEVDDSELKIKNFEGDIVSFAEKFYLSELYSNPRSYVVGETTFMFSNRN